MKPVRYALLQKTLEAPEIERLQRAFTAVRCLVDSDAHVMANDAFGILVRDLGAGDAHKLQGALRTEGVETEMVAMALLPALPATKYVNRIEFGADVLLLYDPLGRPVPVEWRHFLLIAAGNVVTSRETRRRAGGWDLGEGAESWELDGKRWEGSARAGRTERRDPRVEGLTLEMVLTNGVARFSLVADGSAPVLFRCLGERQTGEVTTNFERLVGALAAAAPGALLNRGAWSLRQTPPRLFGYPSRNAFFEEIVWMLYQAKRARED